MDYISPHEVAGTLVSNGAIKSRFPAGQLSMRGALSGALLGFATSVTFLTTDQGLAPIAGAIVFPAGFAVIMIVILGFELVTGSFAMLPAAWLAGETSLTAVIIGLPMLWLCGRRPAEDAAPGLSTASVHPLTAQPAAVEA